MRQEETERSPFYSWTGTSVEKVLSIIEKHGALAKMQTRNPITLNGFDRMFPRHAVVPILRSLLQHGRRMLGEVHQGKTPVAVVIAFMLARYRIRKYALDQEAGIRTALNEHGLLPRPAGHYRAAVHSRRR